MEKKLQQLGNIIKSLNEVNQTFYNEVVRLNKENTSLTEANKKADTENKELISKLTEMNEKNQSTIEAFNVIHNETENRNNALKKAQLELDNTIKQAVNKSVTDERIKKDNEINQIRAGHKAEIQKLNGTIDRQTSEILRLNNVNNELQKTIDKNIATIQDKENAVNYYRDETTNTKNYYRQEIQNKDKEKQSLIQKYEETIQAQSNTIDTQEKKIAKLEEEIKKYKAKEVKININSNPTEPPQTQVTSYEQRTIYSQEKGFVTSQAVVTQEKTLSVDNESLIDNIRQQVEKLYKDEINKLKEEKKGLIGTLQESNKNLEELKKKHKGLTNYLVSYDNWQLQDVEKAIENGMKKFDAQGAGGQSDSKEEYKPNYIK
ncbi:MAG: hypothetical protein K2K16_09960 [Ruminococcus sp.]|nr:hypothetical protein [Ruminococcus sp.]